LQENIKYRRPVRMYRIWAELAKYKLSLAVTFSSATGYFLYRSNVDRNFIFLVAGIFLLSAGSSVLNQYTEREQDAKMERTRNRPLPAEKVSAGSVIIFCSFLLIYGSCFLLINGTGALALGLACVILYNFLYTPLKRISVLAIIPGALVGAIPPVIGWLSAGGAIFSIKILLFSAFIFLWQLPHFWLLIIRYGEEYKAAGFKTIARFLNEKQIKHLVFWWTLLSLIFLLIYAIMIIDIRSNLPNVLIVLNIIFIILFFRLLFLQKDTQDTWRAFLLFNSYGFFIMLALIADSLARGILY